MQETIDTQARLLQAEPVLPVNDVAETVAYWRNTLGFPNHWTWGDPPSHGGVSWNGSAAVQFTLDPERASRCATNSVWILVRNISVLYAQHQHTTDIVAALKAQPWGHVDYTLKDINGIHVTFSGKASGSEPSTVAALPRSVVIGHRKPELNQGKALLRSVGWHDEAEVPSMQEQIDAAVTIVCAETEGSLIGMAFLMGDGLSFYYVKDVDVHPDWQRRGIGTAMMNKLMQWLEHNGRPSATVGLFTGDHLAPFYRQFGFMQVVGMYKKVGSEWKGG